MNGPSVLVVDDEPLARRRAVRLLRQFMDVSAVAEAGNVDEARAILDARRIDVVLLDIQLPGGDGFSLVESMLDPAPAVIFVTAFDHYALRAFDARAIDYVTKPIDPGRLQSALQRAREALEVRTSQDRVAELQETLRTLKQDHPGSTGAVTEFWIKVRGDYVRVPTAAISRFQADRDYVHIHAGGEIYLHHESLASLERRLDPRAFARIHRSTIVRRSAITRLKGAQYAALVVVLEDGSEARIGRTYAPAIRAGLLRQG